MYPLPNQHRSYEKHTKKDIAFYPRIPAKEIECSEVSYMPGEEKIVHDMPFMSQCISDGIVQWNDAG